MFKSSRGAHRLNHTSGAIQEGYEPLQARGRANADSTWTQPCQTKKPKSLPVQAEPQRLRASAPEEPLLQYPVRCSSPCRVVLAGPAVSLRKKRFKGTRQAVSVCVLYGEASCKKYSAEGHHQLSWHPLRHGYLHSAQRHPAT